MPRWFVIANPGHRRVTLFQAALARCGEPAAEVFAYRDLLTEGLARLDAVKWGDIVRIESPGEDPEVELALVARGRAWELSPRRGDDARGANAAAQKSAVVAENAAAHANAAAQACAQYELGRILEPRRWFLGFADLLAAIERHLAGRSVRWMNHPAEIPRLFDKIACHARLAELGVRVPPTLGPVASYDDLRARMRAHDRQRVFVKLQYGSSASGVVALAVRKNDVRATTSVELVRAAEGIRLYNALRVRTYADERDVATIIDTLAAEGLHSEVWMPKAGTARGTFDLRVLLIDGEPRQIVVRESDGPLTNLHLGNRRGDLAAVRASLGDSVWQAALDDCRRAGQAFPKCLYLGIDLAFLADRTRHAILEANACGDLLPGVLWQGEETYETEVRTMLAAEG